MHQVKVAPDDIRQKKPVDTGDLQRIRLRQKILNFVTSFFLIHFFHDQTRNAPLMLLTY